MVTIILHGYPPEEADEIMPTVVEKLGIDAEIYSVKTEMPIRLYDKNGKLTGFGKMIEVPGFEALREHPERLNDLSMAFSSIVPVAMTDAPVALFVGTKRY